MGKIVFVTTELHPETPGGAGVVVDALASALSGGRECVVLLLSPQPISIGEDRPGVRVEVATIPDAGFLERSQAAANALADVVANDDRIEVQDFEGLGFWALSHRQTLGLTKTPITVRFHGPYALLGEAMETVPPDWDIPIAMEAEAYVMADQVLVPSPGFIPVLTERFGVEPDRIRVSSPPVPPLGKVDLDPARPPVVAVVGRLGEMKGSVEMVEASLALLRRGVGVRVRFIGEDGWSPTTSTWMRERLRDLIPSRHHQAFEFIGRVDRHALPDALRDVAAVVVPSRFESFNLAAHEARAMGLPVVVPDIPAFSGLFSEDTGALTYDGSTRGLGAALQRLVTEPGLADRLASAPRPDLPDPLAAYESDPPPRHPRSQAGLGTVAVKRVEAAQAARLTRGGLLQRLYRWIPSDTASTLARFTPRWIKKGLARRASWAQEASRREEEEKQREREAPDMAATEARLAAVEERITRGDYPEVADPRVTVVIPVFNDVRYLPETLASVYEQTYDSWDIVVVDDGSAERESVRYLEKLDRPRVRVIRQQNKGLPAARNAGISRARGEFVIPLDADDELEPEFMEKMVTALDSQTRAAYAHCYARLFHEVDAIWLTRPFNPYWQLLGNGVVGCVLLRKSAWAEAGGYDETMTSGNEDWDLWLRLMEAGWDEVLVDEVLFRYRKHGVSMSVRTEADFEKGRRMVRDRHSELYRPSELEKMKAVWYPMVTAITDSATPTLEGDVESIADESALGDTWGKFVVDLRGIPDPEEGLVMRMADTLEANPDRAMVATSGDPALVMIRRWNLHDPEASPNGEVIIDESHTGGNGPPAHVPRQGWAMPKHIDPGWLPVQRQPPEEMGTLPDPARW